MKGFIFYLNEMPKLDPNITKTVFSRGVQHTKYQLPKLKHDNLGDDVFHHTSSNGNHYYFNKNEDGSTKDLSVINKNHSQLAAGKGSNDKHNIHKFMIKHAETYGKVSSDSTNTTGSKHLWTSLIKSKPKNKSFHIVDDRNKSEEDVDHSNVDNKAHKIWGTGKEYSHIKLEMRHHDE